MSTILKALRRLEQEKAAQSEQPLETAVVRPGERAAGAPARGRWIVGVTAAAALGVGVGWLFQSRFDAPAPAEARVGDVAASPSAASPPPVAAAQVPPTPRVTVAAAPLAVAAETAAGPVVEPLPAPIPVPALPPVIEPEPIEASPPVQRPPAARPVLEEPRARVARAEPAPTAPRAELPDSSALDTPAGAVVAAPVTRRGEEEKEDAVRPVDTAPPVAARAASSVASGVSVLRTIWHPKPERRTALVETRDDYEPFEVREGESVGSLTVVRIEPSGVIFERDGQELRQKVGGRP